jgi:hypothetical protein
LTQHIDKVAVQDLELAHHTVAVEGLDRQLGPTPARTPDALRVERLIRAPHEPRLRGNQLAIYLVA